MLWRTTARDCNFEIGVPEEVGLRRETANQRGGKERCSNESVSMRLECLGEAWSGRWKRYYLSKSCGEGALSRGKEGTFSLDRFTELPSRCCDERKTEDVFSRESLRLP